MPVEYLRNRTATHPMDPKNDQIDREEAPSAQETAPDRKHWGHQPERLCWLRAEDEQ